MPACKVLQNGTNTFERDRRAGEEGQKINDGDARATDKKKYIRKENEHGNMESIPLELVGALRAQANNEDLIITKDTLQHFYPLIDVRACLREFVSDTGRKTCRALAGIPRPVRL